MGPATRTPMAKARAATIATVRRSCATSRLRARSRSSIGSARAPVEDERASRPRADPCAPRRPHTAPGKSEHGEEPVIHVGQVRRLHVRPWATGGALDEGPIQTAGEGRAHGPRSPPPVTRHVVEVLAYLADRLVGHHGPAAPLRGHGEGPIAGRAAEGS